MRPALFLITTLLTSISNLHLQAQESSFVPGEITSAVDSVDVATPTLFDQQAVDTEGGASTEILNVATETETVILRMEFDPRNMVLSFLQQLAMVWSFWSEGPR